MGEAGRMAGVQMHGDLRQWQVVVGERNGEESK